MAAPKQRPSRASKSKALQKIHSQMVKQNDGGVMLPIPFNHLSFTRSTGYDLTDAVESKNIYKLSNEDKLGILLYSSIPYPIDMLEELTNGKYSKADGEDGFFAFTIFDNEEKYDHWNISNAITLMQDDNAYLEFVNGLLSVVEITWNVKILEHYKLSLQSVPELLLKQKKEIAEISLQQSFFRAGMKLNGRLRFNNPFKGIASCQVDYDVQRFDSGGKEKLCELFGLDFGKKGSKYTWDPIEFENFADFIGLELVSKYDRYKGAIWIDPDRIVYDTLLQKITIFFAFASGPKNSFKRSYPKLK